MGSTDRPGIAADLVRQYFSAYQTKDRQKLAALLSRDFTFSSPYDERIDRQKYFERCWPNSEYIRAHHIEQIAENEHGAFVLYACELTSGARFRNTESFRIENGKIKQVEVYFGDPPIGVAKRLYPDFMVTALRAWNGAANAETEIRQLIEQRAAALRAKNVAEVVAAYSSEAVRFDLAPPLQYAGAAAADRTGLENWFASFTGPIEYEITELAVSANGDLGFSHSLIHLAGARADGAFTDVWFRNTLCFRKGDETWAIIHEHNSVPFHMDGSFKAAIDLKP